MAKKAKSKIKSTSVRKLKPIKIPKSLEPKFPRQAPVLKPEQMFHDGYADQVNNPKRCCLAGHISLWVDGKVMGAAEFDILDGKPLDAIEKAARSILGDTLYEKCANGFIFDLNDMGCEEKAKETGESANFLRARIWNLGMALLGYSVNNPEAKYVDYSK